MEKIKSFLLNNSVSVYGIAPASSLESEPSGYRPSDLLAGAKSILCVGMPFPKGVFQAPEKAEQLYWRAAAVYYRHLDALLMRTSLVIEETHGTAVPVYG
jgi:epoxyqueuosine reductase QueG